MASKHCSIFVGIRLALFGLTAGVASGAHAQTAEPAPAETASTAETPTAADTAAAAGTTAATEKTPITTIDAVTVTSQRRVQRISDVPISVTSISGDALAERGITELHEVAEQMAGVQIQRNAQGQPTWMIRGVGLIDFSPNNNPSAAVFQDDVYQVSSAFGQTSLFDVSRVEVLKGPQSGIYGRNTSGGAVRVISNLARFGDFEGVVGASLGTWSTAHLSAAVGGTMVPGVLAGRIAFDGTAGGGDRMRLLSTNKDWGKQDKLAMRGSLLWEMTPGAQVTFIAEVARDKSELLPHDAVGYKSLTSGALCSAVANGYLDNNSCRTWGGFLNAVLNGQPGTNDPGTQEPGRSVLADPFGTFDIKSSALTANGEFELGGVKLVSVTHARSFDYGRSADNDATTGEFAHSVNTSEFEVASQEFRLQSNTPGPLQWIFGASMMRDKLSEERFFYMRDNTPFVGGFAAFGVTSASELMARLAYDQVTDSASVFGQLDYALTDTVNLGAALRWTDEEKTYRNGGMSFPLGSGPVAPAVEANATHQLSADYKLESPWSGKLSIDWKPVPELMTYASVSRGFKVGGFFGGFPTSGQTSVLPYKEETVTAYEIGAKTDAANSRIGGAMALYHYDYKDAQNFTTVFSSLLNRTVVRLDNVGRAAHDGVDLEGWWRPIPELRLTAGASFLDARFLDDRKYATEDGVLASYMGQKRPFAPQRSFVLGADYDIPMAGGTLRLGADANYRSDLIQSFGSNVDRAINSLPGYTLVNLRALYLSANGRLQYGLVVRNVTDKTYAITYNKDGLGSYSRFYGEPRTVRAELTYWF